MAATIRLSQQHSCSFDHLVGEQLQRVGHLDAEQSRRLRVDDELEFARLQDRQFGWLCTFEDLPRVDADLPIHVRTIGPIAHQPAGFGSLAKRIGCGNPIVRRDRRLLKKASPATNKASACSRTRAAKAASISRLVLALTM